MSAKKLPKSLKGSKLQTAVAAKVSLARHRNQHFWNGRIQIYLMTCVACLFYADPFSAYLPGRDLQTKKGWDIFSLFQPPYDFRRNEWTAVNRSQ